MLGAPPADDHREGHPADEAAVRRAGGVQVAVCIHPHEAGIRVAPQCTGDEPGYERALAEQRQRQAVGGLDGVGGALERVTERLDADPRRCRSAEHVEHRVGALLHSRREVLRGPRHDDGTDGGHCVVQRKLRSDAAAITTVNTASRPSFGNVHANEWSLTATPRSPLAR